MVRSPSQGPATIKKDNAIALTKQGAAMMSEQTQFTEKNLLRKLNSKVTERFKKLI
ncbi:MAG: hypothetical protein R2827_09735 [Bdellovibrionales bacterium]